MKATFSSSSRTDAFTRLESILVAFVIVALALIAIPNFVRSRQTSGMDTCLYTRMWIESAKAQWARENKKTAADTPTDLEVLEYMRKVTPMWDGQECRYPLGPTSPLRCCIDNNAYVLGSAEERVRCTSNLCRQWNDQTYRYHYGLD